MQLDHYMDHAVTVQNEIVYFMKEGTVHQPEIFEMVIKGYNIDTSDFTINTAHNVRFKEPNANYWKNYNSLFSSLLKTYTFKLSIL